MPSVSEKQKRLMAMCAHDPDASEKCPPQSVAKEYNEADAKKAKLKKKDD